MKVLLVGESWEGRGTNAVGLDIIGMASHTEAAGNFIAGLERNGVEVAYIPGSRANVEFPMSVEEMKKYDVIILSDIGSNSLLLHPDVQNLCKPIPNRLEVLKQYVKEGGGLLMCGGYMSFSGFMGKARYAVTPIAEALPVEILNYDDRIEEPSGIVPQIMNGAHQIFEGLEKNWPAFLGYNKLKAKAGADVLAVVHEEDAFIAVQDFGKGRTGVFASDIAPHWAPPEFLNWTGYFTFFVNYLKWLGHQ